MGIEKDLFFLGKTVPIIPQSVRSAVLLETNAYFGTMETQFRIAYGL